MKTPLGFITLLAIVLAALAHAPALGQQTPASASAVSSSSSRASSLAIRQNILKQQQAAIQRQISVASRCIATSSMAQVLRDPLGNINRVPQTDLVDCARKLAELRRQLASLQRAFAQLSQDAQVAGLAAERKLRSARRQALLQALSGQ